MPQVELQSEPLDPGASMWSDARLAVEMAAGMVSARVPCMPTFCVKSQAGPVLDHWFEVLEDLMPDTGLKRLQAGAGLSDMLGGLDVSATLAKGTRVFDPGMLVKCHNQILVVSLSSRLEPDIAACLNRVLDGGMHHPPSGDQGRSKLLKLGLIVIDESEDGEDLLPQGLRDRLMFHLNLTGVWLADTSRPFTHQPAADYGPALYDVNDLEELCALSLGFGLGSLRPSRHALQIATYHAGLHGRKEVAREDLAAAIRLGLVHRAVALPFETEPDVIDPEPASPDESENTSDERHDSTDNPPQDLDISAILANLPSDILASLKTSQKAKRGQRTAGHSGAKKISYRRGRPGASVKGRPDGGKRLDLVATLRAAAPWQTVRRANCINTNKIQVRGRDFHVKRYLKPSETTTIFVVDASGSTAISRLAEAKGAVEMLLAESYSRRDHVALISLRGNEAELALSPTRSLAKARKTLSGLRGGGGTPMAHGLQLAQIVTQDELRRGRTPHVIVLTDGSANIPLNGAVGRARAMEDALGVARHSAALGCACLVIDVSRRANGNAKKIAEAMQAEYLPMPFANAKNISDAILVNQT